MYELKNIYILNFNYKPTNLILFFILLFWCGKGPFLQGSLSYKGPFLTGPLVLKKKKKNTHTQTDVWNMNFRHLYVINECALLIAAGCFHAVTLKFHQDSIASSSIGNIKHNSLSWILNWAIYSCFTVGL